MTEQQTIDQSSSLSASTLLLQRQISRGDCAKWRTVLRFTPVQAEDVLSLVALAQLIDSAVNWRVRQDCGKSLDQTQKQIEYVDTSSTPTPAAVAANLVDNCP